MHGSPRFTEAEQQIINERTTPALVQKYFTAEHIKYADGKKGYVRTFRQVFADKIAHCLEGSIFTSTVLKQYGYRPQIICLERSKIDHCLFVYQDPDTACWGGVEHSPEIETVPPTYSDLASMAFMFNPLKRTRGFTHVDLTHLTCNWQTGTGAAPIDRLLYEVPYLSVRGPRRGDFYRSNYKSEMTWLSRSHTNRLRRKYEGVLLLKDLDYYEEQAAREVSA